MRYFKLPDLGEGLTEADIVEWHVAVGERVKEDQLLVSVETAKAIVEVPSPQSGIIETIFFAPGDTAHIGSPLIEYQGENDSVSVVGNLTAQPIANLEVGSSGSGNNTPPASSDEFYIGHPQNNEDTSASGQSSIKSVSSNKASPSVRALARQLNVDIEKINSSENSGRITRLDVEAAAGQDSEAVTNTAGWEKLSGVRKAMAKTMAESGIQVVPVTLFGDADISAWKNGENITLRIIKALVQACKSQPALNAWFNGEESSRHLCENLDVGIAMEGKDGLFVPVLRDVSNKHDDQLKKEFDELKLAVSERTIAPADLVGGGAKATIIVSNYGSITRGNAGRYGTPIVVPPMVAIVGVGTSFRAPIVCGEGKHEKVEIRTLLPLSISFDHRAVTGAEANQFMAELINRLT